MNFRKIYHFFEKLKKKNRKIRKIKWKLIFINFAQKIKKLKKK